MNALFVNACVREASRTGRLCEAYIKEHWSGQDTVVKEVELIKEPLLPLNRERLLQRDRDIADGNLSGAAYRYAREFAGAQEILIGAPYWDCSFPALLKIYLEQVCVNGITFGYGEDGRPVRFCACDRLIVITTAGGYLSENNALEQYWKEMCVLFGIPGLCLYKAEGLDVQGNDPQEILCRTEEAMAKIDLSFTNGRKE